MAEQSGRKDTRVVEDEAISRGQQIRQVANLAMLDVTRLSIQDQQPRGISLGEWLFRDQMLGERIVKGR